MTPPRRANAARRPAPRVRPPTQQTPADLGPRFATLLVELHAIWVQMGPLKQRCNELEGLLCKAQYTLDLDNIDLNDLTADTRMDYSIDIEILQNHVDQGTANVADHRAELDDATARLSTLNPDYESRWTTLCTLAQRYCNLSLDVDFDQPWCLPHINGYQLLSQCARYHNVVKQRQSDVNRLRTRQILLPRNQQLQRTALGDQLDEDRLAEFAREVETTASQLKELSASLVHAQRALGDMQDRFLLEYAGPLADKRPVIIEIDDSDDPITSRPSSDVPDGGSNATRRPARDSPASPNARTTPRSTASLSDDPQYLQNLYIEVRDDFENAQAKLTRNEVRLSRLQAQHHLVFTECPPASYTRFVDQCLESQRGEVQDHQDQFIRIRQRLLDLNIAFPADSVSDDAPAAPTGGGARVAPRDTRPGFDAGEDWEVAAALNVNRRRLNDWRAQRTQESAAATAVTPPGDIDLIGLDDSSPPPLSSPSAPANSERQRQLAEWTRANQRQGDEAGGTRQ